MDTELLRTFLEVRTTRHFGRAARNLFITQAAASAAMRDKLYRLRDEEPGLIIRLERH